jgi:hypothetical protein
MAFVRPDIYATQGIPQNWPPYNQQQPYNPQMQQGLKSSDLQISHMSEQTKFLICL